MTHPAGTITNDLLALFASLVIGYAKLTSSMREPEATTQTRQVRVFANLLTKQNFFVSLCDCVNSRMQENREFAQGSLFNVENYGVVSGL